jgi:SAM-dependent methyltransferase
MWFKFVAGRAKYGRGDGYDAARYWGDRFSRYGRSLQGAGHEGLTEAENVEMYDRAREVFLEVCDRERIDLVSARVLEIGCGTGYWTRVLHDRGVRQYTGLDITDALFAELAKEYPDYRFVQADVCQDPIDGTYDLVIMIDVLEHIVEDDKLARALGTIRTVLKPGGVFLAALPLTDRTHKRFFYLRFWRKQDIVAHFDHCLVGEVIPFRNGHIVAIRRPPIADRPA